MFKKNQDLELNAKNFIINSKDVFKKFIPRDTIGDVEVTECSESDGVFKMVGAVGTISPTGKQKTFKFCADVIAEADGTCFLAGLKVGDR